VCPVYRTGTLLTSEHPILCIFSTNICTEFFKHTAHSRFFLFKMPFIYAKFRCQKVNCCCDSISNRNQYYNMSQLWVFKNRNYTFQQKQTCKKYTYNKKPSWEELPTLTVPVLSWYYETHNTVNINIKLFCNVTPHSTRDWWQHHRWYTTPKTMTPCTWYHISQKLTKSCHGTSQHKLLWSYNYKTKNKNKKKKTICRIVLFPTVH
jgi:hypothetical protein